ncbi:MAG: phosphoribosylformylglycinamidine synthase subunit PurL [Candidatus Bathyarchaeia archaeon]
MTMEDRSEDYEGYLIHFDRISVEELDQITSKLELGLSREEMRYLREHYIRESRPATNLELQTYNQTLSEHCFHKTFKGTICTPEGCVHGLLKSYIRKVVEELEPDWTVSVFSDNAGIIEFGDEHGIAVKVETHNHPSAIEPFGGAATGLGGVIRDVLGVWADPIACTDVLCFGPLDYPHERLPKGVKHPRYLFNGVIDGIGSYGNSMGIPTVSGATIFDEGYTGNVVVYAGCIGILRKEEYIRDVRAGDYVVLAGGKTGLDGIHGVTFASAELSEESEEESRPAVQIANPIEEEKIKRAIKKISDEMLGSGITDIGGGGLSCGVCETADHYGLGVTVELDRVPLKYPEMAPWEIWVSESQERMLLAVSPDNLDKVLQIFQEEQVEANPIGRYHEGEYAKVKYRGDTVGRIHLQSLFNPPLVERETDWTPPQLVEPESSCPRDLGITLKALLSSPNIASKERVVRRYDHEVKGQTVVKPLQGWRAGPNDAAVIKPLSNSWRGVTISNGIRPRYGLINPYWMAASAIDEAVRNNIAVGGRRIALLDNFTWGNPEHPDRLGGLLKACEACYDTGKAYGTPFISGKDSLYNESPLGPVNPTLLITAVGIIPDIRDAVTMDLKSSGNSVYLIGYTYDELGGSEYYHLKGCLGANVPRLEAFEPAKAYSRLTTAIDEGIVRACHDISDGGLGVAASEMSFTGGLGMDLSLSDIPLRTELRTDKLLFSESNGRLLVEVSRGREGTFEEIMANTAHGRVGTVKGGKTLKITRDGKIVVEEEIQDLISAWKTPLEGS